MKFVFKIFLMVLVAFGNCDLLGMEAFEEAGAEVLMKNTFGEGAEKAMAALQESADNVYNLTKEDIGGLRGEFQAELKVEMEGSLQDIRLAFEEGRLKLNDPKFQEKFEAIIKTGRDNFLGKAKPSIQEGISYSERGIFSKMPEGEAIIKQVDIVPVSKIEARSLGVKSDLEAPKEAVEKTNAQLAHDEVIGSQEKLQNLYKSGASPDEIVKAKKELKIAQKTYKINVENELARGDSQLVEAQRAEVRAKSALNKIKASESPTPQQVDDAKSALDDAKKAVKEQKIKSRTSIQEKSYNEMKQAEATRVTAKRALENTEKVYKGTSEEATKVEEAQAAFKEADEALTKARTDFQEETGAFKKGYTKYLGERVKVGIKSKLPDIEMPEDVMSGVKSGAKGAWKGTKWVAEKGWGGVKVAGGYAKYVGELLGQALVFMAPQIVMDQINAWAQKLAMLDTIKGLQNFGNIIMKLPDNLIDESEPSQSKFVYVGLPNKDQKLTKDFLQTANYYVDKPEFGEIGQYAITDPNFPHRMLALDTGFDFVGEGVAFDEEKPTIPLIKDQESPKEDALKTDLANLEDSIRNGPKSESYQMFSMHSSGYAGDSTIADLFTKPKDGGDLSFPPLLQRTLNGLQSGTKFNDYVVQGFRGLDLKNKDDKNLWDLITSGISTPLKPAEIEPYVGYGIYIYQTKDTPFIKNVKASFAHEDVNQQIAAQDLVDYVVMVNGEDKIVPLQVPVEQPPTNFASYTFNHDIVAMVSLIDHTKYPVYTSGTVELPVAGTDLLPEAEKMFKGLVDDSKLNEVISQISSMRSFIIDQAKNGPFTIGSVTMSIDKDLLASTIYIYKIPNYLGTGIDDYVIGVGKNEKNEQVIVRLPDQVGNFVSLVTSRIYDSAFKPMKVTVNYYIMQNADGTKHITTDKVKYKDKMPDATVYCSSVPEKGKDSVNQKVPLYTLFVESNLNPARCNGENLPTQEYWALQQYGFMDADGNSLTIDKSLLTAIKKSHDDWLKALELKDPALVARQMGPFRFTAPNALQDIQLNAVDEAAIMNQNFVYTSDSYPDEYLVLATDEKGSGAGKEYDPGNPQQYLITLSNGYVYAAQAQGGKVPGERVDQDPLDLKVILANAQATAKYSDALLKQITDSEKKYNARIARDLWSSNTKFAQFKFYLAQEDYLAGQYIYADFSSLGTPFNEDGSVNQAAVDKVDNYFVCIEREAKTEPCIEGCPPVMNGKDPVLDKATQKPLYWHYNFGTKLSGDTYAVASLISGASYDIDNTYLGSYDQFVIGADTNKKPEITDIEGFTTRTLEGIQKKSGKAVRLQPTIMNLLKTFVARIKAEQDQLAEADKEYDVPRNATLGGALKKALDALRDDGTPVVPYIDNPNLAPRYLKYYGGKYYTVTPGYISSPRTDDSGKEIDVTPYTPGPDRIYVDYTLDVPGGANMGMVYNSDGLPQLFLGPDKTWVETTEIDTKTKQQVKKRTKKIIGPGWALQVARAFAGISVDKSGKQSRVIGITTPAVAMGPTAYPLPGSSSYLIPTGFDQIKNSTTTTTFDFLYHTKIDSYFVKITTKNKSYYINLTSGYAYNLDGTPRWFESPLYTTKDSGDMLFVGTDQFDVLKLALYKAATQEFAYYTMVGSFNAQINSVAAQKVKEVYDARGTFCQMVNDEDPYSKLQVFQAKETLSSRAPLSYYLVWDLPYVAPKDGTAEPAPSQPPVFLGQFLKDDKLAYSLLLYAQTRNKGEALEKGKFVDDDNYIDPTAEVKKPKTIGIVFDADHNITSILYHDQLVPLQGTTITLKNEDGTTRKVGVTQTVKNLLMAPAGNPQGSGMNAQWISFEDGDKIYDYEYDIYLLNPQPETSSAQASVSHLNLYTLKHGDPDDLRSGKAIGGFGLNTTTFVPAFKSLADAKKDKNLPKEPVSATALASILHPDGTLAPGDVIFPKTILQGFKDQALTNLNYIRYDDQGYLFINKVASGKTKRFVYRLGQKQDIDKIYAAPGLYGWYVDLSNGILYDDEGFPSGTSLTAPQLYTLLDTIGLSVVRDADGNPQLSYRTMGLESQAQAGASVTPSPLGKKRPLPQTRPLPRPQIKRSMKPLRLPRPKSLSKAKLVKPQPKADQLDWGMPAPLKVRPLLKSKALRYKK